MGLLNTLAEWNNQRYEKKLARMEEQGLCPDCHGHGYHMFASEYLYMTSHQNCYGCNGTGSYEDWNELRNRNI